MAAQKRIMNNQINKKISTDPTKSQEILRPKVGVCAIIVKNGKVLLGKRIGAHGAGTWAFPGGHLEFGESIETCIKREVYEETSLRITDIKQASFTNDIFRKEKKHYITIFVTAIVKGKAEAKIMEPDRCLEWRWCKLNDIPKPHFIPLQNLLKQGFRLKR